MSEYKTVEGHPIEVGKWYETGKTYWRNWIKIMNEHKTDEGCLIEAEKWYVAKGGYKLYVIGFNPFNEKNPIVVALEDGHIEGLNASFLLQPAPEKKPVVEGWLVSYRSLAGMTGIVVRGEGDYFYKIPDIKLCYDPNKTGVDSITILEVREVCPTLRN